MYLAENIHGVLTRTLRQQLEPKPKPHDLARIQSHRRILFGTETDRPPIVVERGHPCQDRIRSHRRILFGTETDRPPIVVERVRPCRRLRRCAPSPVLLRSLPIWIGPQIGPAPTKPSVLVVEILTGVVEFHWRFGLFFFFFFFLSCVLVDKGDRLLWPVVVVVGLADAEVFVVFLWEV